MTHKKIFILAVFAIVCVFVFIAIRNSNVADRTLKNVYINSGLGSLGELYIWKIYKIPIVMETDATEESSAKIFYSAKKTTMREILDAVVPKKTFEWRAEGGVIHIIERSLNARPDYPLNAPIEKFSGKGDYNELILKALAQINPHNFPVPLSFGPFPYKAFHIEKQLHKYTVRAHNVTLRQLLDRIILKGGVYYDVGRFRYSSDGLYHFELNLQEEGVQGGLSKIKD